MMSAWTALALVFGVAVITYSMRAGVILAVADRTIPPFVEVVLRNVGPAVLAALAVNLAVSGPDGPSIAPAELAALVVAGAVARWRRNLIATLAAGMLTLWLVSALV